MEKKYESRARSRTVCERILNAIRVSSPNFRSNRRAPLRQQPSPACPASGSGQANPRSTIDMPKNGKLGRDTPVPTEVKSKGNGPSAKIAPSSELEKVSSKKKIKIGAHGSKEWKKGHDVDIPREEGENNQHHHIENRFTEYINRAKLRIRTVSNAGGRKGELPPEKDRADQKKDALKHDDHFTDYINRAKMKLAWKTSSIGGGKSKY